MSTVQPAGTTINLFDYWITGQNDPDDTTDIDNWETQGINLDHAFKFGNDMRNHMSDDWCLAGSDPVKTDNGTNRSCTDNDQRSDLGWVNAGGVDVRQGIVASNLDADGYPVLSGQYLGKGQKAESLGYLFDEHDGTDSYKDAHLNVGGLLSYEDGYYTYDARKNYAAYDEGTNSLVVYDAPAITNETHEDDRLGQFFPFDPATEAFTGVDGNGNLEYRGSKRIFSNSESLNHFFGLTMTTPFTQPENGKAANGEPVTYNFSGDDDVWVFIDGMLVGDLGGIHAAGNLEINFATGQVVVYHDGDEGTPNKYDSGYDTIITSDKQTTTIKGMMLKANPNLPSSYFKEDTLADGSSHKLQFFYLERGHTDSNMSLRFNLQEDPVTTIHKTDQSGKAMPGVTFHLYTKENYKNGEASYSGTTDEYGNITIGATLAKLHEENPADAWVLVEEPVLGCRSKQPIDLTISADDIGVADPTGTATVVHPKAQATAQNSTIGGIDLTQGTTFAVVTDESGWPMTYKDGTWTGAESTDILDAARSYPGGGYVMNAAFRINMDELPTQPHTIAYYHTDAPTLDEATAYTKLASTGFTLVHAARIEVSNVADTLSIHKTDAKTGDGLQGAVFTLYRDADGNSRLDDTGAQTSAGTYTYTTGQDGSVSIPMSELTAGDWLLKETTQPTGYQPSDTLIRIHVDDTGVHVDAGTQDDGVSVTTTLGQLAWSLRAQATQATAVTQTHGTGAYSKEEGFWQTPENSETAALTYDKDKGAYLNGESSYTSTTASGWSRIHLTHDRDVLDASVTTETVITVTNTKPTTPADGTIGFSKSIKGTDSTDQDFTFDLTMTTTQVEGIQDQVTDLNKVHVFNGTEYTNLDNGTATATLDQKFTSGMPQQGSFALRFNQEGTYVFTLTEDRTNPAPGWNYDDRTVTVTVTVARDTSDPYTLRVTSVTYDTEPSTQVPSFVNRYVSVSALPLTGGDTTSRNIMLAGGGVLLLAGAAWLLARRRRV